MKYLLRSLVSSETSLVFLSDSSRRSVDSVDEHDATLISSSTCADGVTLGTSLPSIMVVLISEFASNGYR